MEMELLEAGAREAVEHAAAMKRQRDHLWSESKETASQLHAKHTARYLRLAAKTKKLLAEEKKTKKQKRSMKNLKEAVQMTMKKTLPVLAATAGGGGSDGFSLPNSERGMLDPIDPLMATSINDW